MTVYDKGKHTIFHRRYHIVSRKIQLEFPALKKKYWGKHFWARGYFSATSGNITDEIINDYINKHSEANQPDSVSNIRLE